MTSGTRGSCDQTHDPLTLEFHDMNTQNQKIYDEATTVVILTTKSDTVANTSASLQSNCVSGDKDGITEDLDTLDEYGVHIDT